MKSKIIFFIMCIPNFMIGQINSTVIDTITENSIPFVNIWVKNENIGTTTDNSGKFKLKKIDTNKKIVFSALGYETKEIEVKSISDKIYLNPTFIKLNEVNISSKKQIIEVSINSFKKSKTESSFACGKTPWMNAKFFPYKSSYTKNPFLKSIKILTISKIENAKFNIRLYLPNKNGKPGKYLYEKNIIGIAKKGKKITEVDFSKLDIQFPKTGFFVVFEWLIIKDNEYIYSTKMKVNGTYKKYKDTLYQPSIATILKKNSENNWSYSKGAWDVIWKFNKNSIKRYRNKYLIMAMELKISN